MNIKFKKNNPNAVIPVQTEGNAGMDMTAVSFRETDDYIEYNTHISVEIPEGFVGVLTPRSSISNKALLMCNGVGIIDPGYRGNILFRFRRVGKSLSNIYIYDIGDRIGQLIIMPFPKIESIEVEELSSTERGDGGFGSTGQ